jgi:hypothetical protein
MFADDGETRARIGAWRRGRRACPRRLGYVISAEAEALLPFSKNLGTS